MRPAHLWILLFLVAPVSGQPAEPLVPVDQAVADLDPLATGLRRVEAGLRSTGQQSSLFRFDPTPTAPAGDDPPPGGEASPVYYRLAPGLQARVDRVDYLIPLGRRSFVMNVSPNTDGRFIELVGANTVFDLNPLGPQLPPPTVPLPDHRLDLRVDRRVDGRINPHHTALPPTRYGATTVVVPRRNTPSLKPPETIDTPDRSAEPDGRD